MISKCHSFLWENFTAIGGGAEVLPQESMVLANMSCLYDI